MLLILMLYVCSLSNSICEHNRQTRVEPTIPSYFFAHKMKIIFPFFQQHQIPFTLPNTVRNQQSLLIQSSKQRQNTK